MFCGAGGSSTGAIEVPGIRVRAATNHWDRAIETHAANHPDADHIHADVSQTDPRYFPRTDLLWASPECTNHSVAKGRKRTTLQDELWQASLPDEAAERSRATMWDVPRFAEHHQYRAIITENVVDARRWVMFDAWIMAMASLGYAHQIVYLNSMHAQTHGLPAPQSRDRMYVVFWRKGDRKPDLDGMQRPKAWCPSCDELVESVQTWKKPHDVWGRYRAQYFYRCPKHSCRGQQVEPGWLPAATAIDWTLPAERIGDRKKALSDKTMARIREGLRRYGTHLLEAAGNTYDAANPKHPQHGQPGAYMRTWPADEPLRTLHTTASKGLVLDSVRGSHIITPTADPLATQTTSYTSALLIPVEGREGKAAASVVDPLRTQTTRNETGLLMPYYSSSRTAQPTTDPMGTLTTVDRYALITLRGQNAPKPVTNPLDTVTAGGNHHGLADVSADDVDSCRFRMLEPVEVKRGMAFPPEYVMLGNKREQVRMSGNAVTPPAARDLVATVVAALEGRAAA